MIDWHSDHPAILLNPRMPEETHLELQSLFEVHKLPGHLYLTTSGTTGAPKLAVVSKESFLIAAKQVNERFNFNSQTVWVNPLPRFHVGGLSIEARAALSGGVVHHLNRWSLISFSDLLAQVQPQAVSLVPSQLYDLVKGERRPPISLEVVFVGGGDCPRLLFDRAVELGWPLALTYGMTESASQVASSYPKSRELHPYSHLSIKMNHEGQITLKGDALLSGYLKSDRFHDPKTNGWFATGDHGALNRGKLEVFGRKGDLVNIGGEKASLPALEQVLAEVAGSDPACCLFAAENERLGHVIHLAVAGTEVDVSAIMEKYNARVHPFERIRSVKFVETIPRTAGGKVMRDRILGSSQKRVPFPPKIN